jgi:hypothetical protein
MAKQNPDVYEQVYATAYDQDAGYANVWMADNGDNDHSYLQFTVNGPSGYRQCSTNGSVDAADLVQTSGKLSGSGDGDAVLGELVCSSGSPPTSLHIECTTNGDYEYYSIGKQTIIQDGERSMFQGNTKYGSADCTIDVDGTSYSGTGYVYHALNKSKQ